MFICYSLDQRVTISLSDVRCFNVIISFPNRHDITLSTRSPRKLGGGSWNQAFNNEIRDGEHGVSFRQTESSEAGWAPVVAKRRKNIPVPQYVRHRFPPDHPIHVVPDPDTDSESDCDLDEMILSETASIHYKEIDGTPGLSLWTHKLKTQSWTPVTVRTRSKLKNDHF